jgi:hypothetical protein
MSYINAKYVKSSSRALDIRHRKRTNTIKITPQKHRKLKGLARRITWE